MPQSLGEAGRQSQRRLRPRGAPRWPTSSLDRSRAIPEFRPRISERAARSMPRAARGVGVTASSDRARSTRQPPNAGHERTRYGDPADRSGAASIWPLFTGNVGRAGGGVIAFRGPSNCQGATDMGAHPDVLPGGLRDHRYRRAASASKQPGCHAGTTRRTTGKRLHAGPPASRRGRVVARSDDRPRSKRARSRRCTSATQPSREASASIRSPLPSLPKLEFLVVERHLPECS